MKSSKFSPVEDPLNKTVALCREKLLEKLTLPTLDAMSEDVKQLLSIPRLSRLPRLFPEGSIQTLRPKDFLSYLEDVISQETKQRNDPLYYTSIVTRLSDFIKDVTVCLQHVSPVDYVAENSDNLAWACVSSDELLQCLKDAQCDNQSVVYCACLRLTAILERSLQDLHWTIDMTTPTILKDLLKSPTIIEFVGEYLVAFLEVLVGPPTSLNIRNLVWHGFGSVNQRPELYLHNIFFAIILIGQKLYSQKFTVKHRPFLKADSSLLVLRHSMLVSETYNNESSLVTVTNGIMLLHIQQALKYASQGQFGHATILLMTSFENMLRIAFCIYNDCSSRMMTAISSEYFTTLDHVFEENLSDLCTSNNLYSTLPARLRCAIFDLLFHPNGLRLRDKLSHMELPYFNISQQVWCFAYNVVSTTIMYLVFGQSFDEGGCYLVSCYEPLYHPLAVTMSVRDEFQLLALDPSSKDSLLELNATPMNCTDHQVLCDRLMLHFTEHCNAPELSLTNLFFAPDGKLEQRNLVNSSGFRPVAEWCKLIQSICESLLTAATIINDFRSHRQLMLEERKLRSRQRKNYVSFLNHKNAIDISLSTMYKLTGIFIGMMSDIDCACTVGKSHKAVRQLCENLCSLVEQNKWSVCVEYFGKFIASNFDRRD